MRAHEGFTFGPLNGVSTTPLVVLVGGRYWWGVNGTFGGATVVLQRLGPDGINFLQVGSAASVTAAGGGVFDLPPGQYQTNITGGTGSAIDVELVRIPEE